MVHRSCVFYYKYLLTCVMGVDNHDPGLTDLCCLFLYVWKWTVVTFKAPTILSSGTTVESIWVL